MVIKFYKNDITNIWSLVFIAF